MKKALTFAILLMFAVPVYAQDQQPNTDKLKSDAEKVVRIISRDKAKSQIYCQVADLRNEIDQEKDSKKAQVLFRKMNELEKQLGPEYSAFVAHSQDVDPDSKDGQDIISTFDELDEACPD
jgi:predicted transcriptional regulator